FVSPLTRFPASEVKPTALPLHAIFGSDESPSGSSSPVPSITNKLLAEPPPLARLRGPASPAWNTYRLRTPPPTPGTRLPARDANAMRLPSEEMLGLPASASAGAPLSPVTSNSSPLARSLRTICFAPDVPPRLGAFVVNATYLPFAEIIGSQLAPSASLPSSATLTRVTSPLTWSLRNTSLTPLVSSATQLLAEEQNASSLPSALRLGDST